MRWENNQIEMDCGCSILDRLRIWMKPRIKFAPLKEYKIEHYRSPAKKVRDKFEKYMIEECLLWGEHIRDPLPIASTGDTVIIGGKKEIIVATVRKRLRINEVK